MIKILKYSFYDLMRSRWSYVYFAFYLSLGFVLLFLNTDVNKPIIPLSLTLSLVLGLGFPFVLFGLFQSAA